MRYVLDTCTFLWLALEKSKLSANAAAAIADANNILHLSVISVTETHRLIRKGKISLQSPLPLDAWFRGEMLHHQVQCEPITFEIAHTAETLPLIHNDPADRFILATAKLLGAKILSPDATMPKYPSFEVIW